jgi:hypothetical protein
MLDIRDNRPLVWEVALRGESDAVGRQTSIYTSFGKELPPLLAIQLVLQLCAEVHTALAAAVRNTEVDLEEYVAAVETAAYLPTWDQKLVDARVGETASYLQYDSDTAHKWATQSYAGPQNTLLGDAPAAAAF